MIVPKTCEQSQSPLFALIPAELREYIYQYALGGNTFHIIHLRKRLGVVCCREEFIENWVAMSNHPCWGEYFRRHNSYVPELYARPLRDDWGDSRMNGLLALMKTCRRVYVEATPILYSENVFNFGHIESIFSLQNTIIPRRFNTISRLSFSWILRYPSSTTDGLQLIFTYPCDESTWRDLWNMIAAMQGLRWLKVQLYNHGTPATPEKQMAMLKPLCLVQQTDYFWLSIPWFADDIKDIMKWAKFTVQDRTGKVLTAK